MSSTAIELCLWFQRTDYDSHEVSDDVEDTLPSLKLIKILKEMSRARKELDRVSFIWYTSQERKIMLGFKDNFKIILFYI